MLSRKLAWWLLVLLFWSAITQWLTAVVGLEGTTITGLPFVLFFENSSEVVCQMDSGNDSVWTFGFAVDSFDCQLGEGDDELVILFSRIGDLLADGGGGSDSLIRLVNHITSSETIGFE